VEFEIVREHCKGKKAHKAHGCTAAKPKKGKHLAKPVKKPAAKK
jgi:hypothetical protein